MARFAGRNGRVYLAIASGGTAEPLPFVAKWTLSAETERFDVTALGDSNKVYVAGLPDASGMWSGFMDDATAQSYTAAIDGVARKFYLYPDTTSTTKYFFGTIFPDAKFEGDVAGAVTMEASWNAASTISRVGV